MSHEKVEFRLIVMPCCQHQLCWVNPRLPSYCPECGHKVFPEVRSAVTFLDPEAYLILPNASFSTGIPPLNPRAVGGIEVVSVTDVSALGSKR